MIDWSRFATTLKVGGVMARKIILPLIFLSLLFTTVFAEVKVERTIRDTETITAEDVCLGLKIVRKDFYTYRNSEDKNLDSCVVWIYQKETNGLIIRHKFKSQIEEVWNLIADSLTIEGAIY